MRVILADDKSPIEADKDEVSKQTTPSAPTDDSASLLSDDESSKQLKRSRTIFVIAIIVLILGLVGYWWFGVKQTPQNNNSQQATQGNLPEAGPQTLIFQVLSEQIDEEEVSVTEVHSGLNWMPALGGDRSEATQVEGYVSHSAIYKEKIAIVSTALDGDLTIFLSQDTGKTYQPIFESSGDQSDEPIDDQITSVKFSNDGEALLIALLSAERDRNSITEIPLNGQYEPKKLLESNSAGVFIEGYDRTNGLVIFFEGCYNCDGNVHDELLIHKTATDETTTLLKSKHELSLVSIREDFKELLILETTKDEEIVTETMPPYYLGSPYVIKNVDLTSGDSKSLKTLGKKADNSTIGWLGYIGNNQTPAYLQNDRVINLLIDGRDQKLYESTEDIDEIYYLDSLSMIASTYTGEDSAETVRRVDILQNISTNLLTTNENTWVIGVTFK